MAAAPGAMAATTPALPVAPAAAPLATAAHDCHAAGAQRARGAVLRRAVLCLVNQERALNGLNRLSTNRRLARAAKRHATDMVRRRYFSHYSPSGSDPLKRARAAGWRRGVGEALAWACGEQATPRAIVAAWMASASHRAIIMGRRHAVGIGYKRAPGCSGGRALWVAEVG